MGQSRSLLKFDGHWPRCQLRLSQPIPQANHRKQHHWFPKCKLAFPDRSRSGHSTQTHRNWLRWGWWRAALATLSWSRKLFDRLWSTVRWNPYSSADTKCRLSRRRQHPVHSEPSLHNLSASLSPHWSVQTPSSLCIAFKARWPLVCESRSDQIMWRYLHRHFGAATDHDYDYFYYCRQSQRGSRRLRQVPHQIERFPCILPLNHRHNHASSHVWNLANKLLLIYLN